jgi:hypothetical protein
LCSPKSKPCKGPFGIEESKLEEWMETEGIGMKHGNIGMRKNIENK